ncbi:MAG: hypothetical protein HY301_18965 [Verrucomicrobia bacterium]|nr:hypothetical protein [Verrucomicrobiota bacterium]
MTRSRFIQWLHRERSSARLGFLLQIATRALGSLFSLLWTRLLLDAMGLALNGLFLTFRSLAALGGLGELGMGAAVALRAGQLLGRGEDRELREFLAVARAVFVLLAVAAGGIFFALTPWLPGWMHFGDVAGAGPMVGLFAIGAVSVAFLMLASYLNNLNHGAGNVTWPVVPAFVLTQLSLAAHWWLARGGAPLWLQFAPYVAAAGIGLVLAWFYLRASHPVLARLTPMRFAWRAVLALQEKSFWIYLSSLGNRIYTSTDQLLITAGFGPEQVPAYANNYKLCELAWFVIGAASFASLPKITQWIASSAPADRARVVRETHRLNLFQTVLGCGAALGYLAVNDVFMRLWLGEKMLVPAAWQIAFAANLAVTTCGDAGIQLSLRFGDRGLRVGGGVIGLTGLLNLALSFIAMKSGTVGGIAFATVVAQTVLSLVLGWFVCARLELNWPKWAFKTCVLPLAAVALAGAARLALRPDSWPHAAALGGICLALFLVVTWLSGFTFAFVREELRILRGMLGR